MALYRLLPLRSHVINHKEPIEPKSPLLDSPLDILYAIFDELPLHAKILFSQTCRDLRLLLRSKCYSTVRELSAAERLEFLAALGDILPDRRLCIHCRALHLVDPNDLPVTGYNQYYKPCPAPETMWSRHRLNPYYAIAHRHVQLAIKYTRLKDVYQCYRASILQRFTASFPSFYSMRLEFTAEPVVIHGRFVLMSIFDFHEAAAPLSFNTLSRAGVRFCPHLIIGQPINPGSPLRAALRFAFSVAGDRSGLQQEVYSCVRCPTDYVIEIQGKRAIFYVWQDLGSGISPMDPYWRSHILDFKKNNQFRGSEFRYEHGSVRDLYYSRGTRP